MGLAQELNELFREGRKFSYQKFIDGYGRGVAATVEAFGPFDCVKDGSDGEGTDRWILVYKFANRPGELVALEGYNSSWNGLDFSDSRFVNVVAENEVFTTYRKVEE